MRMKQRKILNDITVDFARDGQSQEEYIEYKIATITEALADYLRITGLKGYILGLSGGVDSFVVGALAAEAVKAVGGTLILLLMPNGVQSDIADSIAARDVLLAMDNVVAETISIENAYAGVVKDIENSEFYTGSKYALGNIQPRLRMVEQYALANGYLVLGTDHATESVTGYYTKHGDGAADFVPMEGLIKPDIYDIARHYNAPQSIIDKAPAAGLGISATDEDELGVSYKDLSAYLMGYTVEKEAAQRISHLYEVSRHKRNLPASPENRWWCEEKEDITHIVVDMQNAFVNGSLACGGAYEAAANIIDYINENPEMRVLYTGDAHSEEHCSFEKNGGIWPVHAVEGTDDAAILADFYTGVDKTVNSPIGRYNIFLKGRDDMKEEYSAFDAENDAFGKLKFNLTSSVVVSGVAAEYCVKETVMDLLKNGFEVYVYCAGVASVDPEEGKKALLDMEAAGAILI